MSRCFVDPCGDPGGQAREHFAGFFLSDGDAATVLEPLFAGDGVRSPRLATNGQSVAMAWRRREGGPGVAGFTREGVARDAAVDLGTSYASSISLAATPAAHYLAAFDQGTAVIVRSVQLDPGHPVDAGRGDGGANEADPDDAERGCGCRVAEPSPARGAGAIALLFAASAGAFARRRRAAPARGALTASSPDEAS